MRYLLLILILLSVSVFINCSGPNPANDTATQSNSKPTTSPAGIPTPVPSVPASATNNAPTLAPVVSGFFEALLKKDEAGVKKYLSAAALKYWEDEGKTAKKTWIAYLMEDYDPIAEKREVRNEKIEGERAVAEIKGGNLGVWTQTDFVRENGEWKFASPADSFKKQDIRKTSPNSNNPNS